MGRAQFCFPTLALRLPLPSDYRKSKSAEGAKDPSGNDAYQDADQAKHDSPHDSGENGPGGVRRGDLQHSDGKVKQPFAAVGYDASDDAGDGTMNRALLQRYLLAPLSGPGHGKGTGSDVHGPHQKQALPADEWYQGEKQEGCSDKATNNACAEYVWPEIARQFIPSGRLTRKD